MMLLLHLSMRLLLTDLCCIHHLSFEFTVQIAAGWCQKGSLPRQAAAGKNACTSVIVPRFPSFGPASRCLWPLPLLAGSAPCAHSASSGGVSRELAVPDKPSCGHATLRCPSVPPWTQHAQFHSNKVQADFMHAHSSCHVLAAALQLPSIANVHHTGCTELQHNVKPLTKGCPLCTACSSEAEIHKTSLEPEPSVSLRLTARAEAAAILAP